MRGGKGRKEVARGGRPFFGYPHSIALQNQTCRAPAQATPVAATARARGSLTSWTRTVRSPPDGLLAASPNEAAHSPLSRCAVALLPPAAVKCAQFLSEFTVPGDNYYDDDRKKYVEMMVRGSASFDLGSLADL